MLLQLGDFYDKHWSCTCKHKTLFSVRPVLIDYLPEPSRKDHCSNNAIIYYQTHF